MEDLEELIYLNYQKSKKYPHMSIQDRAAQFAPFSALTGHSDAVKETQRLTKKKIELEEDEKNRINDILYEISSEINREKEVLIKYFWADLTKEGGNYIEKKGIVKKIDMTTRCIILKDRTMIPIQDIIFIECLDSTIEN
ncbi:MAG: hypothetical protein ACRC7V_00375 [Lachnospiraceae bacterium]